MPVCNNFEPRELKEEKAFCKNCAYLKQFHTDSDSPQELAKLKEIRDDLMRQAELAAHNYCGALGMEYMREREAAFEIKENLHRAGAVY